MSAVDHPAHYAGKVECIDAIEAAAEGQPGPLAFCIGNALKYLWRVGKKGDALEDLKKCRWYVDRAISQLESTR